jgi:hypothetical protein
LELNVIDKGSGSPCAVRMTLKDAKGRPVRPSKLPFWQDHFYFEGKTILELGPGSYTYEIERGPEYKLLFGNFEVQRGDADSKELETVRFVEMAKEGWWSGDLSLRWGSEDVPLVMRGEDLHIASLTTWSNDKSAGKATPADDAVHEVAGRRFYRLAAGRDESEGGALGFHNLVAPLTLASAKREFPPALELVRAAREAPAAHIDVERTYAWDLPVWIASGMVNTVQVIPGSLLRAGAIESEFGTKPRETALYPKPYGIGRWSQDVYFRLLDCGMRIAPSAGSGCGFGPNPAGLSRVYVHCEGELTWDKWWEGLRTGRSVVTNGPLITPRVNDKLPGHVFQAEAGEKVALQPTLNLYLREKIDYLEIIRDGRMVEEVRLDALAKNNGQLPPVVFEKSGWLLIRAVTRNPNAYRLALSAPWYVQVGYEPRISKKSAQFFLDWVVERARRIKLEDKDEREAVIAHHRAARDFWTRLVEKANDE